MIIIAGGIVIMDAALEWRGKQLETGGGMNAIAHNIGYLVGVFLAATFAGWAAALVSKRGLKQALADDVRFFRSEPQSVAA